MKISINAPGMMLAVVSAATVLFAALPTLKADAADLIKVKVGDTTSLAQLGMYAGIQKGIFRKHGIDIERIAIPGGAKVLTALLSGDIDIGYLAASTSLQAQFQDRPVKIIGMSHNMEIYSLLGQNALKGKIKSPSDLKNHTVGISAIGSGSWAFANLLAHLGSLDASRDIKIVPLGNMMAIISALKTNRVDTVTLWEPGTTIALKENVGYSIIDLVDPNQHEMYMRAPHSMVEVMLAKEDLLSTKQDMLRKFFAAQNEAYDWLHSTPMEEVAKVVAADSRRQQHGRSSACAEAQPRRSAYRRHGGPADLRQHYEYHGADRSLQRSAAIFEIRRQYLRGFAVTEAATSAQPSPLAALIEARNFSVTFGANRLVALKGMNLTVHAGEIVVLVGPSGCGKTTFLNSVCGLLPPSAQLSGTLTVTQKVRLGYMPQKDALLPWRTVMGNVEVGPELRGLDKVERRAKAELADRAGRTFPIPRPLSARAVRRHAPAGVAARTLPTSRMSILMDEPFAALDAFNRTALQEEIATD